MGIGVEFSLLGEWRFTGRKNFKKATRQVMQGVGHLHTTVGRFEPVSYDSPIPPLYRTEGLLGKAAEPPHSERHRLTLPSRVGAVPGAEANGMGGSTNTAFDQKTKPRTSHITKQGFHV